MPTILEVVDYLNARDQIAGIDQRRGSLELRRAAAIGQAREGEISFISARGDKAVELLKQTEASLVLVADELDLRRTEGGRSLMLHFDNPRLAFIQVVDHFFAPARPTGIDPSAVIDDRAIVPASAYVGPLATIAEYVTLGERTVIHAGVHIHAGCTIGADCTLHPGAVIGAEGFGFERGQGGEPHRFPHLGTVIIEDNVEIGANSCIDRATLGATILRSGARIDNLVYVAHSVEVGTGALVMTLSSVGGGTKVGDRSWIAPSSTLRDGICIGSDATVGLGAVVLNDVAPGATVAGCPARDLVELRAIHAALQDLVADRPPP